jgi:hypothetical protein
MIYLTTLSAPPNVQRRMVRWLLNVEGSGCGLFQDTDLFNIAFLLVCDVKGWTEIEGVWEEGAEEIFEPKRVGITGGCKKLHEEKLCDFYSSPYPIVMIT